MEWLDEWIPASFRGVEFHVEASGRAGGRRGIEFEYPKRDEPYFEDLGRRAKGWAVTGYVMGSDYKSRADALESALNAPDPGTLQHPTMRTMRAVCMNFVRNERKEEGGRAVFDMNFVEAGSSIASRIMDNTSSNLSSAAGQVLDSTALQLTQNLGAA